MTLAPTYACYGCVPFAHNERTRKYIEWACTTGKFPRCQPPTRWICSCELDTEAFANPIDDAVCWYDPLIPESADFLGVVIRKVTGLRATTMSRELVDAIDRGSILQQPVFKGKQLVFEVLMYAVSQEGMNYGVQWMKRQIESDGRCTQEGASCLACQGSVFTLRVHCSEDALDTGMHSWPVAAAIDGFSLIEDEYPMGPQCCDFVRAGTFTIGTEEPDSYSAEAIQSDETDASEAFQALGNCLTGSQVPTLDDICCPICADQTGCDPCVTDPACDCMPPYELEPEVISSVAPCFTDPLCRCISAATLTSLPAGYDTALRLTLESGYDPTNAIFSKYGLRNTVIRIFEDPEGFGPPATLEDYDNIVARYLPCTEIGISWIPPGATLYIDGLTGRSWLVCNGVCVDHSSRVYTIAGTIFPLKARCTDIIVAAEWDCLNVQPDDTGDNIPSSLTVEGFLGFTL